jgi:hypothetical protein
MTSFDEPDLLPLIELASKYRVVALREKCGEMLYSNDKDIASLMVRHRAVLLRMPLTPVVPTGLCSLLLLLRVYVRRVYRKSQPSTAVPN